LEQRDRADSQPDNDEHGDRTDRQSRPAPAALSANFGSGHGRAP
jgi:hypothetical protein